MITHVTHPTPNPSPNLGEGRAGFPPLLVKERGQGVWLLRNVR